MFGYWHLIFCLPIDAMWHMTYAQDKLLALALSFCHFGMFALLSPTYLTLSVLGLVVLLMGFSGHSLITIFIDNIEIFIPAVLFLASSMYMQKKYITKARQAQCFATQQQKAIEQETHRVNDAKIMGDTIMKMLEFQHCMVNVVKLNQSILSKILYLLKKAYNLQKHDSGQLLILRAIGIAKEVVTFTLDHMVIYASLLYDLPNLSHIEQFCA